MFEIFDCSNRVPCKPRLQLLQIERQVLDSSLPELHVGEAHTPGDVRRVATGQFEHVVAHIYANNASRTPHHLAGHKADLSGTRPEVQYGLTRTQMVRRIAA